MRDDGTNVQEVRLILKIENRQFPGLVNERASLKASCFGDHRASNEGAEDAQASQKQQWAQVALKGEVMSSLIYMKLGYQSSSGQSNTHLRAGEVALLVECLCNIYETLSSIPSTTCTNCIWFMSIIPALWRSDLSDPKLSVILCCIQSSRPAQNTRNLSQPTNKQKIKLVFIESEKPQKDEGFL